MKDQYTADAGDYGKYGLLKFLMEHGIAVDVNWYLTPDDPPVDGKPKDGKHIAYLTTGRDRTCDPWLFQALKQIVDRDIRSVSEIERLDIFKNTKFCHRYVPVNRKERTAWHQQCLQMFSASALVFLDPDNGADFSSRLRSHKEKYAFYEEILDYYRQGNNVLYYCQRGRRKLSNWLRKLQEVSDLTDGYCLSLTFHRGTRRAYIFLIHPESAEKYRSVLLAFGKTPWCQGKWPCFTEDIF